MDERIQQNVLIISDDPEAVRPVLETLADRAIRGTTVRSGPEGLKKARADSWDMLVADVGAAGSELEMLLQAVKADAPEMPVVILAGQDSVEAAVAAVRAGCDDVLVKPLVPQLFGNLLHTMLPNNQVPVAAAAQRGNQLLYQIVGKSPQLKDAVDLATKVAPSSVPVLIAGESGTGKELFSYLIHHQSNRSRAPYVRVNCAALSESLLESELFGHERGAFTGAYSSRKGRFEMAHGGTLLLDEISETTPRLQAELLRVLESQDFERVGGNESIRVNVRIISTTNRDLAEEVERGGFRRDLYFRLNGLQLTVPPLCERKEDVPVLIWHFVNQYAHEARRKVTEIDHEMLAVFTACSWPGNVRQLRNAVRTALLFGEGPTLSLDDAPHVLHELQRGESHRRSTLRLQDLEKQAVLEALRRTRNHYTRAAGLLGITDRTLREKVRRYRKDSAPAEDGSWVRETA